ncbi:MAG: ATPase domain-containing protein [Chloroflexota bacterium]|nr:ATPase domain-containing protein [Chloroflexota bacterium]
MQRLKINFPWLGQILPEGFPVPSSTVITGPGGSGKPLVGNFIIVDWLRQGGSVIFMSLQYPDHTFIKSSIKTLTQLDLGDYQAQIAFISLDVSLDGIQGAGKNHLKANVVKPENWNNAIETALKMVPNEGPGVLLFGSALNLLLFSPTYGKEILEEMKRALKQGSKYSVLFTTSTSAKRDLIAELDLAADNLMLVHGDRATHKLYLTIERMKEVKFHKEAFKVPISKDDLSALKEVADQSRKRIVPLVSKV